jgi:hypothetical protein
VTARSLLELLSRDESSEVRAKSLTALSGILRNNPVACENFTRLNGWTTMVRLTSSLSLSLSLSMNM